MVTRTNDRSNQRWGPAHGAAVEMPSGVTLRRSSLGGLVVERGGVCLGWIHQDNRGGDRWNAYRRSEPPRPGQPIGTFSQAEAVSRIVNAVHPRSTTTP